MKDSQQMGPDGATLEGRMQGLMKGIARDITESGNACDVYSKKNLVGALLPRRSMRHI